MENGLALEWEVLCRIDQFLGSNDYLLGHHNAMEDKLAGAGFVLDV